MVGISSLQPSFFADEVDLLTTIISEFGADAAYISGQEAKPEQVTPCSRLILLTATYVDEAMLAEYDLAKRLKIPVIVLEKTRNPQQSKWATLGVSPFYYSDLDQLAKFGIDELGPFMRGEHEGQLRKRLSKWLRINSSRLATVLLIAVIVSSSLGASSVTSPFSQLGSLGKTIYALLLVVSVCSSFCGFGVFVQLLVLGRVMKIDWVGLQRLPRENRNFIVSMCIRKKVTYPRIGILKEGAPNAFTYGWLLKPRLVVTTGLLSVLDTDEVNAVLAHEYGHVFHWDFTVVAIALMIPVLLNVVTRRVLQLSSKRDPRMAAAFLIIIPISWVLSWLTVLLIKAYSRAREGKADAFAARYTANPASLAKALIKISYLMKSHATEYKVEAAGTTGEERRILRWKERRLDTVALMGISNLHAVADSPSGSPNMNVVATQIKWELSNLWSRWHDLFSSHPSTGRRIAMLNSLAVEYGHEPVLPAEAEAEAYEKMSFASELVLWLAPVVLAVAVLAAQLESAGKARAVLIMALLLSLFVRLRKRYPRNFEVREARDLLKDMRASDVYTTAVQINGHLVIVYGVATYLEGCGVAIRLNIPWYSLAFRHCLGTLADQDVVLRGWYRHGIYPYLEPLTIGTNSTKFQCGNRKLKFGLLYVCALSFCTMTLVGLALALRQ